MAFIPVPPILTTLVGRIALAVPARARTTFLELLLGAAATKSGHVTDAILTSGLLRAWTTYFWFLERGHWSWLQVWGALLGLLTTLFAPAVWHVVVDDTVVERLSTRAPGSMVHHNHTAEPNRPRFLRGQGGRASMARASPRLGSTPCRSTAAPASSTASWRWCAGAAAGSPPASCTAGWCGPSGWSWSARIAATGHPSGACCSVPTRTCPPPRS